MMPSLPQLDLEFASPASRELRPVVQASRGCWFGLALDHRRLFDALADEWLAPPAGETGQLLLARSFAAPLSPSASANPIVVRLALGVDVLRDEPVWALQSGVWTQMPASAIGIADDVEALWWPGPIPIHAVLGAEVDTLEQRARLQGLARQVANIALPEIELRQSDTEPRNLPALPGEAQQSDQSSVVPNHDEIRGSLAMAFWALPRTAPWFDLLTASLDGAEQALRACAEQVQAPWLVELPWHESGAHDGPEATLWRAALDVCGTAAPSTSALVDRIRARATQLGPEHAEAVHAWADAAAEVLRGDREVEFDSALEHPVGVALQLVLARSHPERYKTWAKDQTCIPPAVWWTGALLSGALCGYRRLPIGFRGGASLSRFLAERVTSGQSSPVTWSYEADSVNFRCGEQVIASNPQTARGAWFRADLEHPHIRDQALLLAKRLGWPCIARELIVTDREILLRGSGDLAVGERSLVTTGEVRLLLPADAPIVEALDPDAFRRCLVTRGGEVTSPPTSSASRRSGHAYQPGEAASVARESAVAYRPEPVHEVPGLVYLAEFLSEQEEAELLARVDESPWLNDLKRRVQHYGWKYDYRSRTITRDMKIGPLPRWAQRIAARLAEARLLPWMADQVIVNEYVGKQGISKHIDCEPCFEGAIATVSLAESWHMRFREPETKAKVDHLLARRSVAVMTGDARYRWTHEIPMRKLEPGRVPRKRRVSLTFRKVKAT